MTIKLIGASALTALALAGAVLGSGGSGSDDAASATTGRTTISTTTGTTTRTTAGTTTGRAVEDISGPCDEAEHRNDPRCTGAAPMPTTKASGKNRRGKGKGRSGGDRDRSGSNSGRG